MGEEIKNVEMRELMLWAYAHSPCAHCRDCAVRYLTQLKLATPELLWECLMDSDEETRELACSTLELGANEL